MSSFQRGVAHYPTTGAEVHALSTMQLERIFSDTAEGGYKAMRSFLIEQLETLRNLPMVGDVRGSHLMVCIEFVHGTETGEPYPYEVDIGKRVSNECDELGLIVRPVENLNIMSVTMWISSSKRSVPLFLSPTRKQRK